MILSQDGWTLRFQESGTPVTLMDEVKDFRGAPAKVQGGRPPLHAGSTGRVWTTAGEYFPSVYGLEWVKG